MGMTLNPKTLRLAMGGDSAVMISMMYARERACLILSSSGDISASSQSWK